MRSLWEALPSERRGGYAERSAALEADVLGAAHAGDPARQYSREDAAPAAARG